MKNLFEVIKDLPTKPITWENNKYISDDIRSVKKEDVTAPYIVNPVYKNGNLLINVACILNIISSFYYS